MNHSSEFAKYWLLDEEILFCNHGSFGACPIHVLEKQDRLRKLMEKEPLVFLERQLNSRMAQARSALAKFIGADENDLAFVPNATAGVNTVIRSLKFNKSDEILTTDHAYNACKNALDYVARRDGAKLIVVHIPFPINSPDEALQAISDGVSHRTRIALIDHITSPTAIILPIKKIVEELKAKNIDTIVDGAHAPGMVPLNINEINPAYYTGNCHKWLCAPKGAAFLYVQKELQEKIHPQSISHGYNMSIENFTRFRLLFDWTGTDDPTSYMCVPEAIEFLGGLLPGGWDEIMKRNHDLAINGRNIICQALDQAPPCPDHMIGSMASFFLPDDKEVALWGGPLQKKLFNDFKIEVPVFRWPKPENQVLRISAQLYNTEKQYEVLARALTE